MPKKNYKTFLLLNIILMSFLISCLFVNIENNYRINRSDLVNDQDLEDPSIFTNPPEINYPVNSSDISGIYYIYRNYTKYKGNLTWNAIYNNGKDIFGGYNSTISIQNQKDLLTNVEIGMTLLELYAANLSQSYRSEVINLTNYIIDTFWNSSRHLFISKVNRTGAVISNISYTIENILTMELLFNLYDLTKNSTYLEYVNSTFLGMNESLWDHQYLGYYKSNNQSDINSSKFLYENAISLLINYKLSNCQYFDSNVRNLAYNNYRILYNYIETYLKNGTYGYFSIAHRNWSTNSLNSNKNLRDNSIMLKVFIELYKNTKSIQYYSEILDLLVFLNNFVDNSKTYPAYVYEISWDGSAIVNDTIIMEYNSLMIENKLDLFLLTNNGTYYIEANQNFKFIDTYFWDVSLKLFNYSISFSGNNNSEKYFGSNSIAIRAMLDFKIENFYLTRANTTMSLILNHLETYGAFNYYTANDWTYSLLFGIFDIKPEKVVAHNALTISTLIELARTTGIQEYIAYAENITKFLMINTLVNDGFIMNVSNTGEKNVIVYLSKDNALMIKALIDLYEITNNLTYLELANSTWYFLNSTFWDSKNYGYNYSSGTGYDKNYKLLISNIEAIQANLRIIETNYSIFNDIRNNASLAVNRTLNMINQYLWDNTSYGYFYNASESWTHDSDQNNSKQLESISLMIKVLLHYNKVFPSHPNYSKFETYCINSTQFLLDNFIDTEYGGVYKEGYDNGTIVNYRKNSVYTSEFIRTLILMYEKFGNQNYYKNASSLSDYVNTFYWDFEHGGYYFDFDRTGTPIETIKLGIYGNYYTKLLISNIIVIDMLLELYELEKNNTDYTIIVENNNKEYNFNEKNITFQIELFNSEGIQINNNKTNFLITGIKATDPTGKKIYGLGSVLQTNYNAGKYESEIDISPFLDLIVIGVSAFNISMYNTFNYYKINRSLPRYLDLAYQNINTFSNTIFPMLKLWDSSNYGYYQKIMLDNKTAFGNLMAIRMLNNFIQTTGVNYGFNWSGGIYDQILSNYISGTLKYINNISKINETLGYRSIISSTHGADEFFSNVRYCKDNALAIITFLELFNIYNDSTYLEAANQTWKYINDTLWDTDNQGFFTSNNSLNISDKELETQFWALIAYSNILNTPQINEKIKNSSSHIINITINKILNKTWDTINKGFYSSFNGTTWMPFNDTEFSKTSLSNIMAIKALLTLYNITSNMTYYNKAVETLQFLDNNLKDNIFGGYYEAVNGTNFLTNTNKSVFDNGYCTDVLLDFYLLTNNYTYFDNAERVAFYLTTFAYSEDYNLFLPKTSRIGTAIGEETRINSLTNFIASNALINLEKIRTTFKKPLLISNLTINEYDISSAQKDLGVYIEITDLNLSKVNNVTVLAYLYGVPELFEFTRLNDNLTYYNKFNISMFSKSVYIHILILNESYASTYYKYSFERKFPTYIKIAYETLASMYKYLQYLKNAFYNSSYEAVIDTSENLQLLQSILDIKELIGSTILTYNWFNNDTLMDTLKPVIKYLKENLGTYPIQNISGFHEYTGGSYKENITKLYDNALAVITFLNIFDATNDSYYLKLANETWLYINMTFWDDTLNCYRSDNSSINNNISALDNFLAILAGIKINQTKSLNNSIRNQALILANTTYNTINNSFWDSLNGGYYSYGNGSSWTEFWNKETIANSLSILVNLEMHKIFYNTSYYNLSCYRMANLTAQLIQTNLWDYQEGGFYRSALPNWTLPKIDTNTTKYTLDNSWAIIALMELYNFSGNIVNYYYADKALHFLITFMGNQTTSLTTPGFSSYANKSGYLYSPPIANSYPGDLTSSSLCIQALLKVFNIINKTYGGNWLNGTAEFSASSEPPIGEYANISFTIKDKYNNTQTGQVNITVIKWHREGSTISQVIYNNLETYYNENTSKYHVGNINISNSEYIFIYISARNNSFAPYYGMFFIQRVPTDIISAVAYKNNEPLRYLPIFGSEGNDPEKDYAFYAYVLGEDQINIRGRYVNTRSQYYPEGIPNACVNATIYYPNNGSKWDSKLIYTDIDGWFEVTFGPVANLSILEGIYNITFYATHVNTSISPNTWYSSTSHLTRVSIGYGIFISNLTTKNLIIAQGDTFTVNLTIKNERISSADANITFFGEKHFIIEVNKSVTVDPGFTSLFQELRIDERSQPGDLKIYVNITYQGRWIHTYYLTITVIQAIEIKSIIIPSNIAQNDQREIRIELQNFKKHGTDNITIRMQSPALQDFVITKTLQPNETREFLITIFPVSTVSYGTYTGTIEVQRQNYTLQYLGSNKYEFSIEIVQTIDVTTYQIPTLLVQGQSMYISIFLKNKRTSESKISIVYYWENLGTINVFNYTLTEYMEEEYIYIPISYVSGSWDLGYHNLLLQIYFIDENGTSYQIYETEQPIIIEISSLGFFINYILPSITIIAIISIVLYLILRKKEEKKKQKK
ncbi:MAG: hypothetical protein ACTSPY_16410 [Candidatus Helarchaeota archaeon]